MPSFRLLNQAPQYLLPNGDVNAGGKLFFYETDLTTPKNTWSDEALTTLNPNPVVMDAAGRTLTDVWLEGEYGVVMTDADDNVVWTRNNVKPSNAEELTLPALAEGEVWMGDGSGVVPATIIAVPDPTGHEGDILKSDGVIPYWAAPDEVPEADEPDIEIDAAAKTVTIGTSADATKYRKMFGTATAPASGTKGTSVTVNLPTPLDAAWLISLTVMVPQATPSGAMVDSAAINWTQGDACSSFTAVFNVSDDDTNPAWLISEDIDFAWAAEGTVEIV